MKTFKDLQEIYNFDKRANERALREYREALRYYHGHQLPPKAIAQLQSRGQTPIIENIYKMIVNKILGYKIQSLTEIKVSGRQEQDKPLATLLNDLLKAFSQQKEYDKTIIARDKDLIFGLSVIELWVESDANTRITLKHIPTDSFIIDAYSTDKNALDARWFHKKINVDLAQAKEILGKEPFITQNSITDPRTTLIESWILERDENGKSGFNRYIWAESGEVYLFEEKPFAKGVHPFVIAKYAQDENNVWYGLFRDIKPMQDYINFAENRMANMMGSFKALFEEDAVIDTKEFIRAASLDNAIVKVRSGALRENKIQFVQHHADIAALSQKANEKRNLAKILSGLNDEALGMAINRQSGVAIAQRRDAGLMGLQDFIKSGDEMDRLLFEKVLFLMQNYYDKAQTFKIVDEKVGARYFEINTNAQNRINIGEFDLIYKSTLKMEGREERFAHWSEMLKTIATVRPDIVGDLLPLMLKDTDSPIIADLEELLAQKAQSQSEQAQALAPLEKKKQELEIAKLEAELAEMQGKAQKYSAQGEIIREQIPLLKEEHNAQMRQLKADSSQNPAQKSTQAGLKGGGKYGIKGADMR